MEVTDIRMRLVNDRTDRLKAFCTVTFDEEFVIRDVKLVEGPDGFFIAMPSRKLSTACPMCKHKNQVRARFCEECGKKLKLQAAPQDPAMRTRLYRDIAHPITPAFREKLQNCVIDAYRAECDGRPEEDDRETDVEAEADVNADVDVDANVDADESEIAPEGGDAVAETDQYDTLIADLKGGARAPGHAGDASARPADRRETRNEEPHAQDRRRRETHRRREEPSAPQHPDTPGQASEPPEQSVLTAEPHDSEQPVPGSTPVEPEPEKAQEAPEETRLEDADRVSLDETAAEPTPSDDSSEDTETPFGAGIV